MQDDTQDLVRVLIEENRVMRHELNVLKAQMIEMQAVQDCLSGTVIYDEQKFLRNMSVRYLTMCKLDRNTFGEIIGICEKLDYPCMKYLIKFALQTSFFFETFYDKNIDRDDTPLKIFRRHGCLNMLLNILKNFCEECDMENATSFAKMFVIKIPDNVNHVLDICIEHDFDFEHKTTRVEPFIHLVLEKCSMSVIKRIIDFYVLKKFNLNYVTHSGKTLSDALMSNCYHHKNIQPIMLKYLNDLEKEVFV